MQPLGEERNASRHLLIWLVQYGTTGKCPSFCCKDFFVTFFNFWFMLTSIFNSTVRSIPCQSNNMQQARQCTHLNHDQTTRHWLIQCKRIWRVCSAKNKEQKREIQVSRMQCSAVCYPVFRGISHPTCISEDQLTPKLKSRTHKCK
jgi:hypothetical protein